MSRFGRPRPRGPGFAPFARHAALRSNVLIDPDVEPAVIRGVLARRGIAVGDRDEPLGPSVRALVAVTRAGTLVTLEHRTAVLVTRRRRLRELDALLLDITHDVTAERPVATTPEDAGGVTNRDDPASLR